MNKFTIEERIQALKDLKIKAPGVFKDLIIKRTTKINKELNLLRSDYQSSKNEEEKIKITEEGKALKRELQIYLDADK